MGGSVGDTGLHLESYQNVMAALTTEKCEAGRICGSVCEMFRVLLSLVYNYHDAS